MKRLLTFLFALCAITMAQAQDVTISSQADWDTFANNVSNGTSYSGQTVRLTNDISVTTMVGTEGHLFMGTFDGNGHTLTVNLSSTENVCAPFPYISGATIENLTIEGDISGIDGAAQFVGGLVGRCEGYNTNSTIRNCTVNAHVYSLFKAGGFVATCAYNIKLTMEKCVFAGAISDFNDYAGGLIGFVTSAMTINLTNCLVKGSFSTIYYGRYHPIGCKLNSTSITANVTDCYYLNTLSPTVDSQKALLSDAYCTPVDTEPWTVDAGMFDGVAYYAPASSGENYLPGDMNGDHKYTKTDIPILVDYILGHDYHECIDLGLPSRTLWAKTNVGTAFSSGPGSCFAWGETTLKSDYSWNTYKWCIGSNDENGLTKYCYVSTAGYNGFTDTLTELLPEDDAATANWGSNWCTPTVEQWNELLIYCNWTWSSGSPAGYTVKGPSGNTIFLPATGYHFGNVLLNDDSSENPYGAYWSRTLATDYTRCARAQIFSSDNTSVYSTPSRDYGLAVRPVRR